MSHEGLQTDSSRTETINQGEESMKPELLTKKDAAITSHGEENVRARAYELYQMRAESMAMRKKTGFKQKAK
jgi:hypothetical protein